jgi:Fur family ferric uptake transcriptional regulator
VKRLLERIDREIRDAGGKKSRSRSVVMERFFHCRDHLTVDELTAVVRGKSPRVGAVTVYRTLKLLVRMGYAKEVDFGQGAKRYENNLVSHHDHMVCRTCGSVTEFEDPDIEKFQDIVARRHGFRPTAHRLEIFGICRKCASAGKEER